MENALSLPIGELEDAEKQKLIKEKAENFRRAVETRKKNTEQDKSKRVQRKKTFDELCAVRVPSDERQQKEEQFWERERRILRAESKHWTTRDFEQVGILGKGAFGVVHLARVRGSGRLVALKQMPKSHYHDKNLRKRAFSEREILAERANRWFVDLVVSFQDPDNFYMVMEFVQGGDLLTHLEEKLRFTKDETRFYMGELLQAIGYVHKAGFVHCDIKPDNCVLTIEGHLKLLDFGLCKPVSGREMLPLEPVSDVSSPSDQTSERRRHQRSARGTPQYMAPEALTGEVHPLGDVWAVGVMIYECLTGSVMFASRKENSRENQMEVMKMVSHHKEFAPMRLDRGIKKNTLQKDSRELLEGIITCKEHRFTLEQCKSHDFFAGLDFESLHALEPPIVPRNKLDGPLDTRYFPKGLVCPLPDSSAGPGRDTRLEWANYEFNREAHELQQPEAVETLFTGTDSETPTTSASGDCPSPASP